ncbi:MAG: hypothetical protein ABIC68_06150 [Candidatus Omnitrophota bacterium]
MRKIVCTGILLMVLAVVNAGCALIGPALGAGAAYGIYMATRK